MTGAAIDVWDEGTFDKPLAKRLADQTELLLNYFAEGRRLWQEREMQTLRGPMPSNAFGAAYSRCSTS